MLCASTSCLSLQALPMVGWLYSRMDAPRVKDGLIRTASGMAASCLLLGAGIHHLNHTPCTAMRGSGCELALWKARGVQ